MNLAALAIRRPIFTICIVLSMMIVGGMGLKKIGVDLFPDVSFPVVAIQTVYPGAPPADVEKLVSKKIEEELGSLSGLKRISSNNLESVSVIVAEFNYGVDLKEAEQQVRDKISNIRRNLPLDIKDPVIRRVDPSSQAIMRLSFKSKLEAAMAFDLVNDVVRPRLERIKGVGQVSILGARKREIHVAVDKDKLQGRELSLLQISKSIEATSKDIPIGKVDSNQTEVSYRSVGEFQEIESLKKVNINFIGSDRAVLLSEVATISEGLEREQTRSLINGEPAIFLDIFKQSGGNTVEVSELVTSTISTVNELLKERGADGHLELLRDGARPIHLNLEDVQESIVIGIILCIVVVFFFLGSVRSTFITGMALPNSLLGAFFLMYISGFSLNVMTLLALSLAVGLLIDDAIVVRENIFRYMEKGMSPKEAAEKGTNEVAVAVIATTLVVISVFGPIAFMSGIIGQFFKEFGLTMVFAVIISTFDALTMAPMMSAYLATASEHKKRSGFMAGILNRFDAWQSRWEDLYEKILHFTLDRPKTILFATGLFFVLSLGLVQFIPKTFLPAADNGEFEVRVELKPGSNLEATAGFVKTLEDLIRTHPEVAITGSTVGTLNEEVNKGVIYVRLVPKKLRKLTSSELKDIVRNELIPHSNIGRVLVTDFDPFGGGIRPFNLNVTGEDLDQLSAYVELIKSKMEKIPGLVDVDTNYRKGKPEFHVQFDRPKSESLGVSTVTAGMELRARVEGLIPATFRFEGNEYNVRVRLDEKGQDLRREFSTTNVPNVNFNMIPLSRVASGIETTGYSQINRMDRARYVQISGDIDRGGALNNIMEETDRILAENPLPKGMTTSYFGQAQDFIELIQNFIFAISFGILLIYLVLSSLYESFITPFTILLALPFAMSGAFISLLIGQSRLDIFAMIGIVMLLGVVAKNSILLVDYTNQLMAGGKPRREALLIAGRTRLRPILMTSFALIAGMIPIAIGLNEASSQRTSMGIALIGGLISSTMLTLVVVPAAFGYVDDVRLWTERLIRRIQGRQPLE